MQEDATKILENMDLVIPLPKMTTNIWPVLKQMFGWEPKYLDKQGSSMPLLNARYPHPRIGHTAAAVVRFRKRNPIEGALLDKHNALDKELYTRMNSLFVKRWEHVNNYEEKFLANST